MSARFSTVEDVILKSVKVHNANGLLSAYEANKDIPFAIQRVFVVSKVTPDSWRGDHAHKECRQALVCVGGKCEIACDDGEHKKTFLIESPGNLLVIPTGIWVSEKYKTSDTVLLVLCDKLYDADDYLRNYDGFLAFKEKTK